MFSKVAVFITALFVASAVATPTPIESSCNTGAVQCCNTFASPNSAAGAQAIGLFDTVIQSFSGQVGFNCNPITVFGVGAGANCASHPVCCEHNDYNQLVGINCSPITIGA